MNGAQKRIVEKIAREVRRQLASKESGHDWWHVMRVHRTAKQIGKQEGGDMLVIELAALLHDIADWKAHGGDVTAGPRAARRILKKHRVSKDVEEHVAQIISTMSFKGARVRSTMRTLEGKIVQDADRLDALGAIGIARAFSYGGYINSPLHDPAKKPKMHRTKEAFLKNRGSTINHFYEKLLLLKGRMNTKTAKQIAKERHRYTQAYLKQFFREWSGRA
jgi:uncharacterized protein